jgi:LysM repeat protein
MKTPYLVLLLLGCCLQVAWAQNPYYDNRPLKVGLGMSGIMYYGDLSDDGTLFHRIYPGANLSIQSEGKRNLRMQLNAGFGRFAEQYDFDKPSLPEGVFPVNFVETSFFYGDLRLKYRLLKKRRVQPYLSAGAGFMIFSPQDENGKFLSEALRTRPEGETYNTAVPQMPLSAGVQARISPILWLGLEYTYRYTPTDYLDNVGQLGRRPGNDQLHNLLVTLYFNLSKPNVLDPEPEPWPFDSLEEAPVVALPPPPLFSEALKKLSPPGSSQNLDPQDQINLIDLRPAGDSRVLDSLNRQDYWENLAWKAWQDEEVFYYRPRPGDTYEGLYERFRVKAEIIQDINQLEEGELPLNSEIIIPDLRRWLKDMVNSELIIEEKDSEWYQKELSALQERRYIYYRVRPGDELESLAARFKTRVTTIKKLNSLVDDHIYVDSYLRLPDVGVKPF